MADIEMVNEGVLGGHTPESVVQPGGGGGEIEMYGGSNLTLSHTPIGSEQKGGNSSGVDWAGVQGLMQSGTVTPYNSKLPTDKGEV